MPEIQEIEISLIITFGVRRPLNTKIVDALADSIKKRGLQYPIDVYALRGTVKGKFALIAGAHRLAAFEKLGRTVIPARILSRDEKFAWHELENLLRAELTVLEMSEALAALGRKLQKGSGSQGLYTHGSSV
jgi:ParB family chromosome partitioning protein